MNRRKDGQMPPTDYQKQPFYVKVARWLRYMPPQMARAAIGTASWIAHGCPRPPKDDLPDGVGPLRFIWQMCYRMAYVKMGHSHNLRDVIAAIGKDTP